MKVGQPSIFCGFNGLAFASRKLFRGVVYCYNFYRRNGLLPLVAHLRTEVLRWERPGKLQMFFAGVWSDGRCSLRRNAFAAVLGRNDVLDVVITFSSEGGAVGYLQKRLLDKRDCATLVIRNTNAKGVFACQVWERGRSVVSFYTDDIWKLLGRFPHIRYHELFVNELVGWGACVGESRLTHKGFLALVKMICEAKRSFGARLVVAVHDYFFLCPRINLIDVSFKYCGFGLDVERCGRCLEQEGIQIAEWRKAAGMLFDSCDELRCFSEDSKNRVLAHFPGLSKITVVPHFPLEKFVNLSRPDARALDEVVVGVVGSIDDKKGRREVLALSEHIAKTGVSVRIVVIGMMEGGRKGCRNLRITGSFRHDELPILLRRHRVGVAFFPSVCPETFSFVVHELMAIGIPVVCFDLGAQAEYVRTYRRGRVVPIMAGPDKVLDAIRDLYAAS